MIITEDQIRKIGSVLNDKRRPLKERFRALFTLKSIGGKLSIHCIAECFKDTSVLLKHELAYCLGQMRDPLAVNILLNVLQDVLEDSIVRHEAAEALGAIGSPEVIEVLERFKMDNSAEVAETCEIAVERIKWLHDRNCSSENLSENPFASVDPAPPSAVTDITQLKDMLFDSNASLFDRYRAMFSLRNMQTNEATLILGNALSCGSSLFRHEIAFVLGQLRDKLSVPFLKSSLENCFEHQMVRHECAEALGAISTDECIVILKRYLLDDRRIVKESCEVALDMCDYENSPEFQYANTLSSTSE